MTNKIEYVNKQISNIGIAHIFFLSVIIRFVMTATIYMPGVVDEIVYKTMALSYHEGGTFDLYSMLVYGESMISNASSLYPKIISLAFYFGENFDVVIRLINVVIISLSVFPSYALVLGYSGSKTKAKIAAVLVVMMPFHMNSIFAMPESLYFLLVVIYIYLMSKYILSKRYLFLFLAAADTVMIFATKPNGLAMMISIALTIAIFVVFDYCYEKRINALQLFGCLGALILSIFVICGGELQVGGYSGILSSMQKLHFPDWKAFCLQIMGHIEVILFMYFIPICVLIAIFFHAVKNKQETTAKLIITIVVSFGVTFLMVMKFSNDIGPNEGYYRLHARYYYFFYAILIIAFYALYQEQVITKKASRTVVGICANMAAILFILHVPAFINILVYADNLDLSVFLLHKNFIYVAGILSMIVSLIVLVSKIDINKKIAVYTTFLIAIFSIGNYGQVELQQQIQREWQQYYEGSILIQSTIKDRQAKVFVIYSNHAEALMVMHFNQFDYLYSGAAYPIAGEFDCANIPLEAEYVVCFGKDVSNIEGDLIANDGGVYIYDMRQGE